MMKMFLIMGICFFTSSAFSQNMAVEEIVKKANLASYYAGKTGKADVKMTIKDAQSRVRNREFRILRFNVTQGGEQKFYVYFHKPSDVAKMVFMVWKHLEKDDDRWLYLPALDLVRRISSSDKRSSFVGSHFVYEDVSGRSIEADIHELMETTQEHYVIKNTPKQKKDVEFASYTVWIDKNNFIPKKAEYYDEQRNLIKTIEALEIQDIQGYPTVIKTIARDLVRGGETINEFSLVEYDIDLTDEIFQERYLRKAPVQWIK